MLRRRATVRGRVFHVEPSRVPRGTPRLRSRESPLDTLRAAIRTQLRLRLRALSTWGLWAAGIGLTGWGCVLDVLAVGLDVDRPLRLALGSGGTMALLLGTWIGCATPARQSLRENHPTWAALPDASWALPTARCLTAAACGGAGVLLCVLVASVLSNYISLRSVGSALCGGTVTALLASAWAGLLAPRVGALPAMGVVLALAAAVSLEGLGAPLASLLPAVRTCTERDPGAVLAASCAALGLVALTPRRVRADGGTDPAT